MKSKALESQPDNRLILKQKYYLPRVHYVLLWFITPLKRFGTECIPSPDPRKQMVQSRTSELKRRGPSKTIHVVESLRVEAVWLHELSKRFICSRASKSISCEACTINYLRNHFGSNRLQAVCLGPIRLIQNGLSARGCSSCGGCQPNPIRSVVAGRACRRSQDRGYGLRNANHGDAHRASPHRRHAAPRSRQPDA